MSDGALRYRLTGQHWTSREIAALQIGKDRWSYAQLIEMAEQRMAQLGRRGFSAGQLLLCPASPVLESLLMQYAASRLGGAVLPIRADLSRVRRQQLLEATGAEWLWQPLIPESTDGRFVRMSRARDEPTSRTASAANPAVLIETSGSQGPPKIVMLSAANVFASCSAVNARLELHESDAWLCALPRQHVGGLAIGYRCALAGATMVVQECFDPDRMHRTFRSHDITHVSLVPAMLHRLLERGFAPPTSLRVVLMGGQALDPNLARRAVDRGWPLYLGYGMTETFTQIAGKWIGASGVPGTGLELLEGVELDAPRCNRCDVPSGWVQQGPGADRTKVSGAAAASSAAPRIADAAMHRVPIRVRGPMLMLGYANRERETGLGLENGWLQTNDLGCLDPSGYLKVAGRADEAVVIAGINVLPADVERRLVDLGGVDEVAVVGVPDEIWGHRLVAFFTGTLEPANVERWCRHSLPSHLRPRGFARVSRLPLLASGKPDRKALASRAAALTGNRV